MDRSSSCRAENRTNRRKRKKRRVEYELQVITNQKKASHIFAEMIKSISNEDLLFLPNNKTIVSIGISYF